MVRIRTPKHGEGFTLIELMIVVAIIGILAAIAIPNFTRFQLRSRAGEGKINLAGIRTAEESYMSEYGRYIAIGVQPNATGVFGPGGSGGNQKVNWAPCPNPVTTGSPGHCIIGWFPDGPTYYNYALSVAAPLANSFVVGAESDIDGEGTINYWGFERANLTGAVTAPAAFAGCPVGAVLDLTKDPPISNTNVVGPCGIDMGSSTF